MKKNMGSLDRIIRSVAGLVLVVGGVALQILQGQLWWLAIPGVVLLLTSVISWCPVYVPLKINTGAKED